MSLWQDGVSGLAALVAVAILVRRLLGFARPSAGAAPGCANCPSGGGACHTAPVADIQTPHAEHPLVLMRPPQR